MTDFNSQKNRTVWVDIPVVDLDRACAFYAAILACPVPVEVFGEFRFGLIDHKDGNGGCLVICPGETASDKGLTVYFNADGRIRDAVTQAVAKGGKIVQDTHSLGPHGFRAVLLDSEGNRIAVHSNTDQ